MDCWREGGGWRVVRASIGVHLDGEGLEARREGRWTEVSGRGDLWRPGGRIWYALDLDVEVGRTLGRGVRKSQRRDVPIGRRKPIALSVTSA